MKKNSRAKILFQKYLDRIATEEELEEMFRIFEDRGQFASVYALFEAEWESQDVTFDLENLTLEKVREDYRRQQNMEQRKSGKKYHNSLLWWSSGIAAELAVLVGIFIWSNGSDNEVIYQTGYGETKEIVLEDNSVVKLNANSRLAWRTDWEKTGLRELTLDGEAFFDVNQISNVESSGGNEVGDKLPFRVVTPDLTVNVYGTTFNVISRRQKTDVFLKSGVVKLELNENLAGNIEPESKAEERKGEPPTPNIILMEPGDAVSYSVSNHSLEQVDNGTTQANASWTEGSLSFDNERLAEVLQQLEDIYGKQFEVSDTSLLNRKVNLGVPYEDWSTVSGLMTLSLEIEMKEVGGKIILEK